MFSIIIPIYNAERYLRECIDSLTGQKDIPMELLLIDDGSRDSSLQICREYAEKDSRIRVFYKENSGVSDTRNFGIARARERYILFVDADDYLVPDALGKISRALTEHNYPDMLAWRFASTGNRVSNDDRLLAQHPDGFQPRELLDHLISIDANYRMRGFIWRCAFKRDMLQSNGILFHRQLKMAEDFKFLLDAILVSGAIPVLQETLYIYRINDGSVTFGYKQHVHRDIAWVNHWMEENLLGQFPQLKTGLDCCCSESYIVALQNLCNPGTPYSFAARVSEAWKIKADFGYKDKIRTALSQWRILTRKRRLVYLMLWLGLEPLYVALFSIKRKTLFFRSKSCVGSIHG